jgi:hypothetical protein
MFLAIGVSYQRPGEERICNPPHRTDRAAWPGSGRAYLSQRYDWGRQKCPDLNRLPGSLPRPELGT